MELLRFDELNALSEKWKRTDFKSITENECEDIVADLIEIAYVYGTDEAANMLGESLAASSRDIEDCKDRETDGKTFRQRIADGFATEKPDISRIIETEMHRAYNEAIITQGKNGGAKYKKWGTMLDSKVRDSHRFLEGVSIPIEADFYVPSGSHGPYPGSFRDPEEDINCRCFCTVSKGEQI